MPEAHESPASPDSRHTVGAPREPGEGRADIASSRPVAMAPRPDGFEVVWSVRENAFGRVEWQRAGLPDGIATSGSDAFGFVPRSDTLLRVRVDEMEPGTEYRYRTVTTAIESGLREESEWRSFRTLDPTADTARIVAWNDTHQVQETIEQLHETTPAADVWVWNGDVCNHWNDASDVVPTIVRPGGLDVTEHRPMAFSWGNHDARGEYARELGEVVATPNGLPYYAMRVGPIAAIVLTTGEDKPDAFPSFRGRVAYEELRRRQAAWLAEQVQQPGFADAPYRVVFCHMPLRWVDEPELGEGNYAAGEWDEFSRMSRDEWHDTLVDWGVQVIVSGHTHIAETIEADEAFPYVQITGGGEEPDIATWIDCRADRDALVITTTRLDGERIAESVFPPR